MELAKARLVEISQDMTSYATACNEFLSNNYFSTLGEPLNIQQTHCSIIQPYIEKLCRNIDRRFGDAVGKVSVAANVFNPGSVKTVAVKNQFDAIRELCTYFQLDPEMAIPEWKCFVNYLLNHSTDTTEMFFQSLLTTDIGDSFPTVKKLAEIVLSCPIGTAGQFYYYLMC